MKQRFRKSPRLKGYDCLGPLAAHVVLVTRLRRSLFVDEGLASLCIDALHTSITQYQVTLHAYCLMSDHLHLLIEVPDGISLEDVVHNFKTRSGHGLRRATGESAWQTSYYDHLLRREEAIVDVAGYIWANPVRAGLTEDLRTYAWSGPRGALMQA